MSCFGQPYLLCLKSQHLSVSIDQCAIVVKHAKAVVYHPLVEAAALTLVDIPISFIMVTVFSFILYFMVGL